MTDEVMIRREGAAGFLSLNRPKAIHALTLDMVHAMTAALLEWRNDPEVAGGVGLMGGYEPGTSRSSAIRR